MSDDSQKFLGLTKGTAEIIRTVVQAITVVAVLVVGWQVVGLLQEGAQAHKAICAYRSQVRDSLHANQHYLRLTPAQRVKQYGEGLAHIPEATLRKSAATEARIIDSLSAAGCK